MVTFLHMREWIAEKTEEKNAGNVYVAKEDGEESTYVTCLTGSTRFKIWLQGGDEDVAYHVEVSKSLNRLDARVLLNEMLPLRL